MRPNASRPSLLMKAVRPPRRAAATAWLEPLPPGPVRKRLPSTVSPQTGRRGVRNARSATKMPITQTRSRAMGRSLRRGAGDMHALLQEKAAIGPQLAGGDDGVGLL